MPPTECLYCLPQTGCIQGKGGGRRKIVLEPKWPPPRSPYCSHSKSILFHGTTSPTKRDPPVLTNGRSYVVLISSTTVRVAQSLRLTHQLWFTLSHSMFAWNCATLLFWAVTRSVAPSSLPTHTAPLSQSSDDHLRPSIRTSRPWVRRFRSSYNIVFKLSPCYEYRVFSSFG
jgi:hypothetical protein